MRAENVIPAVSFRNVSKRFPGTVALQNVSFDIASGSCHALMGENGAGKSTLGKILAGIHHPDGGELKINGLSRHFHSPLDAQRVGVAIVHQELSFCPNLSVAENICLSDLPRRAGRALEEKAHSCLNAIGADCDVREELWRLSPGHMQMVQIAAVLATGAKFFVMDEPTSSLSAAEAKKLEELVGTLRQGGATIIYVSHRMDEIFRICDTVTVMRDGEHIATMPISQTTENELVRLMIGRSWERMYPSHAEIPGGEERLRVENFSSRGKFKGIRFSIRAGEVLGIAGLMGSGRTEVAHGLFGIDKAVTGDVYVDRKPVKIQNPRDAMALGIGLVSEDRKGQGLVLGMGCGQNISLSSLGNLSCYGIIESRKEDRLVEKLFFKLRVKAASTEVPAQTLSGGNQQKLVLAKWLARECKILILDEPTRGVDVGAKAEIHKLIDELAASGLAVLMISSELPEVINLSSRVMVMRNGQAAGILDRHEVTEEKLMQLMAGQKASRAMS